MESAKPSPRVSSREYLVEAARNLDFVLIRENSENLDSELVEAISRAILYIEKVLYGKEPATEPDLLD